MIATLCLGTMQAEAAKPTTNLPPVISGTPSTSATVGSAYAFQPSAYDPEGRTVTFKVKNKPAWATFSSSTGRLSGVPTVAGPTSTITISATDGSKTASLRGFSITVTAAAVANRAPTISGTPLTAVESDRPYSFRPTAADADGDSLVFSIANKPSWAAFDTTTGTLQGTPTAAQAGTYANVTIGVSDGKTTAALSPFSITVTAPVVNRAPTISGTPVTAAESDRPYSFRATAADPDGDTLVFSIGNKPSWATFDATTGTLYGTPTAAQVGTYANVTIGVSDGKATAALAPFSITVASAPTRSVTLNWTAPTSNTDGTALTNLAGYTLFYGNASRQYQASVRVPDAGATSVVLEGLAPGTWYFAIRSFNNTGLESDYSGEISANL
jgi:Putative Ig domain./Fibronectin type III domain.